MYTWTSRLRERLHNSYHVVTSVYSDFPVSLAEDALFHYDAFNYPCRDLHIFHDDTRDVPWEDI